MDEEGHPTLGPGEFSEFAIHGHPRLDRSAKPPLHEFPWQEIFSRCDGEPPEQPREFEAVAEALGAILRWIVEPKTTRQVGFRVLEAARAWGHADLLTPRQKKALRSRRWAARKKARPKAP